MTTSARRRGAIAAAVLATAVTAVAGTVLPGWMAPANASTHNTSTATTVPDITVSPAETAWIHKMDHQMGAEIRLHEKTNGSTVVMAPDVTQTAGLDVSGYQGNVDWSSVAANGAKFAYVKATEGTDYTNPYFAQQYNGSYNAGLIRGSYHFAHPDASSGATQADYFIAHGGGWSGDGKTLPGALDIEWNPSGDACYGMAGSAMVNWVLSFSNEYHAREGVWPVIYTAASWWSECTGNQGDFSSTNPLWLANYNGSPGTMPYAWGFQTFWQFADSGTFPGDQDYFNGPMSGLQAIANG
jgi:GH25 family lysozyme M1 (1,4-beta-N-acetylmuramidase)